MEVEKLHFRDCTLEYFLKYDDKTNTLVETKVDWSTGAPNLLSCTITEGERYGKVKFTAETVDTYIEKARGGFLPIFHPSVGIFFTREDLNSRKDKLSSEEYEHLLKTYPRLQDITRIPTSENAFEVPVIHMSVGLSSADGKTVKQETIIDNREISWWNGADTPLFDVRELLKDEDACRAIATVMNPVTKT